VEYERTRATVKHPPGDSRRGGHDSRDIRLDLEAFTWEALEGEAEAMGISIEELVGFSVLYYLADRDSGRIARHLPGPGGTTTPQPDPLRKLLG
jgi:hypothetical protein